MGTRISARIADELAARIKRVQERTRLTLTELVRRGLERACEDADAETPSPLSIFERNGFVACGDGPVDGSGRVKDYVREHLGSSA